jgi:hypothetical protein
MYVASREHTPGAVAEFASAIADKEQVIFYFHGGLSPRAYIEDKLGPELMRGLFRPE